MQDDEKKENTKENTERKYKVVKQIETTRVVVKLGVF